MQALHRLLYICSKLAVFLNAQLQPVGSEAVGLCVCGAVQFQDYLYAAPLRFFSGVPSSGKILCEFCRRPFFQ